MAQGFQTFNEDGSVDVDVTSRLPRLLGMVSIGANQRTGRISNSGITPNTAIWWFLLSATTNFSAEDRSVPTYEYPTITQGDGFLDWSFPSGRNLACTLLYGVY